MIIGIGKDKDESGSKCDEKVINVCKNLKVDISESDIDRADIDSRENRSIVLLGDFIYQSSKF